MDDHSTHDLGYGQLGQHLYNKDESISVPRKRRTMADHTKRHDPGYGRLGLYLYNKDDSIWVPRRSFGISYALQPLTPSDCAVKPAESPQSIHDDVDNQKPSRRIRNQVSAVARVAPGLGGALELSASLVHLSEHVFDATASHDSTFGNLLTFGRVWNRSAKRIMEVAAFPSASSATSVCLMQVQLQKQGWKPNKDVWIDVPRIVGESGTWNAGHAIRQLSFSTPLSDDPHAATPYLAVRTSVAVHVLRIALNKGVASWDEVNSRPSRFNLVASSVLSLDLLGAVPPAHVAFNPAYDKQVATIDQYGTWRVWELSRSAVGRVGKPLEIASGATADTSLPSALAEGSLLDDGWGRITWAGTASTIIVVSRKAIGVYDVEYKPKRLVTPDLGIAKTPHWILDMQISPGRHPIVFVLTSTHIICLRIRSVVHDQEPTDDDTAGAYVVFRTPHFRDSQDITLTLSTFQDAEGIYPILLHATLTLIEV